jgi:hypothetical protein
MFRSSGLISGGYAFFGSYNIDKGKNVYCMVFLGSYHFSVINLVIFEYLIFMYVYNFEIYATFCVIFENYFIKYTASINRRWVLINNITSRPASYSYY